MQLVNYDNSAKNAQNNPRISTAKVNSAVVIPAFNPVPELVGLVEELLAQGIPQVIVVNDGSDSTYHQIFLTLKRMAHCTVLTHGKNRGKGAALKTAFRYFTKHYGDMDGVVTADADGQHTPEDIYRIARQLSLQEKALILGVRNFRENNVPKRSYLGNTVTSRIFWLFYGQYLQDTQTGLRGIPTSELGWMAEIKGERYDYEVNMLIQARFHDLRLSLVPIKTLYFDNNAGSHYRTVKDSLRIFGSLISGLIEYAKMLIVSGALDLGCFFVLYSTVFAAIAAPVRIFTSTLLARLLSSACNYALNRRIIFADTGKIACSALRYYLLWVFLLLASYGLVYSLSLCWSVNVTIIKLTVDFLLGFISYQVQLRWVFRTKETSEISFPPGVQRQSWLGRPGNGSNPLEKGK
jgi:glycosyltransferase involved in cell wall biosynthesis